MSYYVEGGEKGPEIYALLHDYELDGYDTLKVLGIYSSALLAERAQARFELEPGFREHKEGFAIVNKPLNEDWWSEGFTTVRVPLPADEGGL